MKILLIVNTFGSFISHRRNLYLKIRETHQVQVLLPTSEDIDAARKVIESKELLAFAMSRKGVNPLTELRTIFNLYCHYKKEKPELVHHFTIKPVIYGSIAARLAGVPKIVNSITGLGFVFTSESLKARILGFIIKNLYRLCFASNRVKIIFQNSDDRDFFIFNRITDESRCNLVEGSGVDIDRFSPNQTHNTVPCILLASRLLREKGIYEFMEAVELLKKEGLEFEAIVAGDIDLANPGSVSVQQFKKWRQADLATFLGHHNDMPSLLKTIDIACLPSYREGLPMFLLEAMAAGKPIVTTDAPGCRTTVKDGKNGFLVPTKTIIPLAKVLKELIITRDQRLKMGEESRKLAIEFFSKERITSEITKIYYL